MSKCWYCNEELTTANYSDKHIGICTRCYNSMFKFSDVFVKGLTDKIADLELKLAEKETRIAELEDKDWYEATIKQLEKQNERLIKERDGNYENYSICWKENEQLKQQLAEKDKEIESLKASSDKNIDYLIEFASLIDNEQDCNRMLKALDRVKKGKKYIIDKDNQDKISFAVEQLEKVKYSVLNFSNGYWRYFMKNGKEYMTSSDLNSCLKEYIDDQIKQLKETK